MVCGENFCTNHNNLTDLVLRIERTRANQYVLINNPVYSVQLQ